MSDQNGILPINKASYRVRSKWQFVKLYLPAIRNLSIISFMQVRKQWAMVTAKQICFRIYKEYLIHLTSYWFFKTNKSARYSRQIESWAWISNISHYLSAEWKSVILVETVQTSIISMSQHNIVGLASRGRESKKMWTQISLKSFVSASNCWDSVL